MEPTTQPLTREESDRAALEYMASLPLEHFMEAEPQAFQRLVSTHSFAVVKAVLVDFYPFNELAIQYRLRGRIIHVVPDNMTIFGPLDPRTDRTCFCLEHEQSPVFWVLEYVSQNSKRKDYVDSFKKYEALGIRYYLTFDPYELDLRLFKHDGKKYVQLKPDDEGHYPIPELEMEVGMVEGWVRFWFRGELIPLPAELYDQLREARRELDEARAQLQRKNKQLQRKVKLIQKKDGQIEKQTQQIQKKDEQLQKKDEQLQKKDEQLQKKDGQIEKQTQQIQKQDEKIVLKEQQLQAAVTRLRITVQRMAQRAGRQDILTALSQEHDLVRLNGWVDELA